MSNLIPWGESEKKTWFNNQTIKRSYRVEVLPQIEGLRDNFDIISYGFLSIDPKAYPLYLIKSKNFNPNLKTIMITGGVHGYETSGVHGAISFMSKKAREFEKHFNFICAPCISPWAYETINRWNTKAIDPNRSFIPNSPAEECELFLNAVKDFKSSIFAHFDLHETTDTDNSVFRPALEKRDAKTQEVFDIPDGFYVVGDSENPKAAFQKAIIESVRKVTHIAPADENNMIIGAAVEQNGVINYPLKKLSLCAGFSGAEYTTTTEVYPDSPRVTPSECVDAQVAAIVGGLNHLLELI